jgi:iron complex transport system permease protein
LNPVLLSERKRLPLLLAILLVGLIGIALFLGRYPRPYGMAPGLLFEDQLAQRLVLQLRLPRILIAVILGMTLAACGLSMQMIFRNPLVEPGFLGVTQGAAFGAALSILWLGRHPVIVQLAATVFGLAGLFLSYGVANRLRFGGWVLRLVLAGIAISAFFSAGVGLLKYVADPLTELQEITFWLLGGLWAVQWRDVWVVLPFVAVGLIVALLMRWRLNLLSLKDETAFSLGAVLNRERLVLLVTLVTATAAITSISGTISWVGLIIPHIARRLSGASAHRSMPVAMLLGGIFTLACDTLARTLLAGEIPLGILTSLLGAVFFIYLMISSGFKVRQ